jgi:hypothetical protein
MPTGNLLGPFILEELDELRLRQILFLLMSKLPHILALTSPAPRVHLAISIQRDAVEIATSNVDDLRADQFFNFVNSVDAVAHLFMELTSPGKQYSLLS